MAVYSKHRIEQLEGYATFASVVRHLRFVFYLYAFLSFVFWFLNCLEVDWLYKFNWLFIVPYKMVKTFYSPEGVSSVDFSLAIIGAISLVIGFIIDFLMNRLYEGFLDQADEVEFQMEKMREQKQRQKKKTYAKPEVNVYEAAAPAAQPVVQENPFEDSKLLFIIQPHIVKIKKKESDLELTFQDVEIWKQRVNKKLIENVSYSKPMQKGYYRKNLFLVYKDFFFVDDFVYYINPTIDSIKLEFQKYGIAVSFNYVLSAITKMEMLEKELDCMDTILSLNFKNEYIVTNRFKVTYDNKAMQQYKLKLKGEYNLSKNLSISNRQALYSLISKKQEGE